MKNVVAKARDASGTDNIMVCERGVSFGYGNLVSDMRRWRLCADPVAPWSSMPPTPCNFLAHKARPPAGNANSYPCWHAPPWRRGERCFMETHPDPAKAWSDGPNAWPLRLMKDCSRRSRRSTGW